MSSINDLTIEEVFDGIKSGHIELQKFHTWLCTPLNRELSDEEIDKIAEYHGIDSLYESGRLDFARAILKKASEK